MVSTSLGVEFKVLDLSAKYEVVGTSDNYSFQYELGRGNDIVSNIGDTVQEVISLKGNYGVFKVRVFAVSDIGIRSSFLEDTVNISPPEFDGTFTFSNLKIDGISQISEVGKTIIHTPEYPGDKMIVNSEYIGRDIKLSWDLLPPAGHPLEGAPVSSELLSDKFFDHFKVKIKNGADSLIIEDSILDSSAALRNNLSTDEVSDKLNYYRDFNLHLSREVFEESELNLSRTVSFEIVGFDVFGNSCTGMLTGVNYEPNLTASQSLHGSKCSFAFSSLDTDFESTRIRFIAIPEGEALFDSSSIELNQEYYASINGASDYVFLKNEYIASGDRFVVFEDGHVYKSIQDHVSSDNLKPGNSDFWQDLGEKVPYITSQEDTDLDFFEVDQLFGYSYYYDFQPFDAYGSGAIYNLSEDSWGNSSLALRYSQYSDLKSITSSIKIRDLSFRERGDSLVFDWKFEDQDGLPVAISSYKYLTNVLDAPSVIGVSGHLFDNHTDQYLSGIFSEEIIESFSYSREKNNQIYKNGGYPPGVFSFDPSLVYSPGSSLNNCEVDQKLFSAYLDNSLEQPYIKPVYELWDSSRDYYKREGSPFSDIVSYNDKLFEVVQDFGPGLSSSLGLFNETSVYKAGDVVLFPVGFNIFTPSDRYFVGEMVLFEGSVFECLRDIEPNNILSFPDSNFEYWKKRHVYEKTNLFLFKANIDVGLSNTPPSEGSAEWSIQTPGSSSSFSLFADSFSSQPLTDNIYSEGFVFKRNVSNPTLAPTTPLVSLNQDYSAEEWTPFWELDDRFDDVVFKHVGIPEGGKRSVGLEVGIVDSNGTVVVSDRIIGDNPAPTISSNGFSVDSQSEVTKVKFNFNYIRGRQEKTTLLNLYRSDQPDFEITGSDGLPFTEINQTNSTFVKSVLGEGDATFGDNITQIVDDTAEVGEEITGYYYKLLPFDDFGSGVLYTAVDDKDPIEKVWVLPKNFHSKNPDAPTGPAIKITTDEIPGPVKNLEGETAFENYFLNWNMPNAQIQNNLLVDAAPNDISYYEVWQSAGQPNNFLQFSDGSFLTEEQNATGYRRIDGIQYTFGDNIPTEYEDFASGIVNATNVLDIDASSPSIQITHRGQVNDTSYFWVRPVDHAGNKGPFTGASDLANTDNVEGLKLILGQAKTTDIADFEQNITKTFPNTVALVPNNPFKNQDPNSSSISWESHYLYNNGTGYYISAGSTDDKFLYFTGSSLELTEDQKKEELKLGQAGGGTLDDSKNNPLRNVVFTGDYDSVDYHPAGQGQGTDNELPAVVDDSDFIIARNVNGVASPMWHAFANALIGSAHIENAAITNAKIHNLTADKIRSAEIKGQDIQVGLGGGSGQIRSAGFDGLADTGKGFVVSGDGSFVFAADDGRLHFDDGELILEGKFKTVDGKEYTFIDLDASPDSFFYSELSDGTYVSDGPQTCEIRASFQNSFVQGNQVRFRVSNPNNGYEFIKYSDTGSNGGYNISGFKYDPSADFVNGEPKVATAEFKVDGINGGFNQMINTVDPQLTTIIVSASGLNTSTERSIPINFVADGAAAVYAELKAQQQVYSYDYDGKFNDTNLNLNLEATAYNTHGNIEFLFETGVNLEPSSLKEIHKETKDTNTTNTDSFELANFADNALQYYNNTPFVAKLTISDEDGELASDFVSVFGTLPGKDSYTVFLTNENHTYPAQENGSVTSSQDYVLGQTKVKFFRGNTEYTHDKDGLNTNVGTYRIDSNLDVSPATVSARIVDDTVDDPIIEITDLPKNVDEGTITINIYDNQYYGTTEQEVFSKVYTFSKTKEGAKGRQLELTAPDQTIEYNSQGSLIGPNSVTITANTENFFDANPEFEFYSGDFSNSNIIQSGVGNTYTHDDIPGSYDSDHIPVTILCKAFDSLDGTTFEEKARDQITIFGIKEGANAITFVQSQEFANVPVANSSSGDVDTPDFSSTTNEIKVFEGIKELTYGGFDTIPGNTKEKFYITSVKVKNASDDLEISSVYIDKTDLTSGSPSTTINVWNDLTITNVYLEYSITVVNHEGLAGDFSIRQNVTLTFDGTIARKVDLTADQQSVTYDTAGSSILSPSTNNGRIKLTATDKNTGSTVKFKFAEEGSFSGQLKLEDGTTYDSSEWSDGNEVYYHPPSSRSSFNSDTIKVEISENENNVLASDVLTIYAIQDGSDVITAILSNEAHSLTKDFEGIITSTGSGTDIKVFQGAEELTFVTGTGNPSGENTFTVAIAGSLPTGVTGGSRTTPSNKKHCNVAEYNFSSFTGQSATITYTITFKNDVGETGTITKQQTFSISQEGEHARKVDLTGDQAVKYNTAGSSPDPNKITLTATALNQRQNSTLQYKYTLQDNPAPAGSLNRTGYTTDNTVEYTPKSQKFKVDTVMVEMREDGIDVAKDTLSIYGIQDGSDVITAILSNEAHSFTADSDGNVSDYGGGQTSIQVFQGATELNFSIADVGNDASKYNVAKTEGGIDAGNLELDSNGCRTSSVSNMTGNSAFIDFTITGRNDEGIEFGPINKVQTFSKSIAGEGEIGNRGVGVVFRGLWESDKIYIGATETSDRGDVVFYDDGNLSSFKYWIAQEDHTSVNFTSDKLAGKWESFGAEFESVATDLLLSKDAVITHTLTMGQGDINGGNEYVGHGGLIKTVGKEFGNGVTGFFLGNTGNPPNPQFDVGGESSFIRFDGDSDRVEIKGSLIINSRDNNNLNKNSIDGEDAIFIGGGYNNSISGLGSSIVGGGENDISGRFSFIGGGFDNNMGDNFSAIVAGYNNEMPNTGELHQGANLIGAGIHNIIDGGTSQTIVNGSENLIQQTGNVGDELVAFDGQQGWLSPGFLGTFSGYGGGGLAYNKSANFVDDRAGWVENSWWPSYKKDWGVNTLSNVFYIGNNRGINQSAWVYHTDLKWCLFPDQSSEIYNDAEYRIYNSLYGKAYPNKDSFYVFMAGFDPDFQDFYFWYKDEGFSLAQSGGSLGLGITLYRHILPAAYDATTTYVAGELAADPGDGKYYKSTNGVAAGVGTPSSTAGWTVADSSDISSYGWYFLKKDNSEIKLYHFNTQQWHSPISVP